MDQDRPADQTPIPASASAPAQEVGTGLKETRISRGYTLESVCQRTRIPRKFLEALEAGRFDDLPAPVYLRSFLAGYCEYLELDFQPLWDRLHPAPIVNDSPAGADAAPSTSALPHDIPATADASPDGVRAAGAPAASPLEASPHFNALLSALGGIVLSLALALALVWWAARGQVAKLPTEESLQPQALQPMHPLIGPKLVLMCRDETWVSVKADGVILFAGRLPMSSRQEFQARKLIVLRTPVPANLALTLNGSPYRLPRPEETGEYRIVSP